MVYPNKYHKRQIRNAYSSFYGLNPSSIFFCLSLLWSYMCLFLSLYSPELPRQLICPSNQEPTDFRLILIFLSYKSREKNEKEKYGLPSSKAMPVSTVILSVAVFCLQFTTVTARASPLNPDVFPWPTESSFAHHFKIMLPQRILYVILFFHRILFGSPQNYTYSL